MGASLRHQPRIGLVHDVVAAAPPLPHGIENDELGRHGAARDQQPVGLGDRPAQPVDARRRQPEHGERSVADPLQARQIARRPPPGVSVEPAMTTRMASTPTRRGQAGAQQPAKAAALARVGMVADIDVAERAMRAARGRHARGCAAGRARGGRVCDPPVRGAWCASPVPSPVRPWATATPPTQQPQCRPRAGPLSNAQCGPSPDPACGARVVATPHASCALQCGPFCGSYASGG